MIGLGLGALLVIGASFIRSYWGLDHDYVKKFSLVLSLCGAVLILMNLIDFLGLWQ